MPFAPARRVLHHGDMNVQTPLNSAKFHDPDITADGQARASVTLDRLETLWLNTGTLCNLACANCYIESSPTNDRLEYITLEEAVSFFDEIASLNLGTREIGLTGGEPFMNPATIPIIETALERGFSVLVLTNAMKPMHHKKPDLLRLRDAYGDRFMLRVSLDHYTQTEHEQERGATAWAPALEGLRWLSDNGFAVSVAGRSFSGENDAAIRAGFARLFAAETINIDAADPHALVVFPEMDETVDVPEITTACWDILDVRPQDQMCATSRMVVKHKGRDKPTIMPCTLLPYDAEFEMGETLETSAKTVKLNHPHCARFCVLGGASCSG